MKPTLCDSCTKQMQLLDNYNKRFGCTVLTSYFSYCKIFISNAKVYSLSDINGNVFYVGCTTQDLQKRFAAHIAECKGGYKNVNQRKRNLIISLNYQVVITELANKWVTGRDANVALYKILKLESYWIEKYRSEGFDLVNQRKGLKPLAAA